MKKTNNKKKNKTTLLIIVSTIIILIIIIMVCISKNNNLAKSDAKYFSGKADGTKKLAELNWNNEIDDSVFIKKENGRYYICNTKIDYSLDHKIFCVEYNAGFSSFDYSSKVFKEDCEKANGVFSDDIGVVCYSDRTNKNNCKLYETGIVSCRYDYDSRECRILSDSSVWCD